MTPRECAELMLEDARGRRAEPASTREQQLGRAEAAGAYDNCSRFVLEHLVLRYGAKPKEPGFYWMRKAGTKERPLVVNIVSRDGVLWIEGTPVFGVELGLAANLCIAESGFDWAGPLPEPEEEE